MKDNNKHWWEVYTDNCMQTLHEMSKEDTIAYCKLKLIEEAGEFIGSYAKEKYHGKPNNDIEELGDMLWYIAVLARTTQVDLTDIVDDKITLLGSDKSRRLFLMIATIKVERSTVRKRSLRNLAQTVVGCARWTDTSLMDICKQNTAKLAVRHGKKYNPNWYNKE